MTSAVQEIEALDPSLTILSPPKSTLGSAFFAKSVAVVGATEKAGTVGRTIQENLVNAAFDAKLPLKVYPVNPTRDTCLGLPCYKSVQAIPHSVDLAIIVTPAKTVPDVMRSCGEKKVPVAIVISAGFKELGEPGLKLENEVLEQAKKYGVRLIGPNCLGIINPNYGLNATFAGSMPAGGSIAFMSQSGAMCTAALDWSMRENIGFSSFVSIGSMADVNWGHLIDFLGNDPATKSILIYMETIGDAAAFLSAAKEVAHTKPIIVIKAGRTEAAAEAAASHTGSLAGSHDAFIAAMRRVGVLAVDTIGELFSAALVLGKQPRPTGPNLMIITNAGGPGVLATDAAAMSGAEIATLDPAILEELNTFLPAAWSHANPVDVLGDAKPDLYARTLKSCLHDKGADGVLVILSPQSVTEPTRTAQTLIEAAREYQEQCKKQGIAGKPIMASWMGGKAVAEGFSLLNQNDIPCFEHPDAASRTFAQIWKQSKDLVLASEPAGYDAPAFVPGEVRVKAEAIIKTAKAEGRDLLTEAESKQVLKCFDIAIAETIICETPRAAAEAAKGMGFPVVVKLHSNTITHKSDVGGVKLNINSEAEVLEAYESIQTNVEKMCKKEDFQGCTVQPMLKLEDGIELIMGSVVDPQFGPLVLYGMGGCMVEVFQDTNLSLPPLTARLAQRQVEETKIYKALKGGHGERFKGTDLNALQRTLVRFSQMVAELKDFVSEIDINPLLAMPNRLVALDARFVLRADDVPIPQLAIRPYPREYVFNGVEVKDGLKVDIRPAHSNDIDAFAEFNKKLSRETILQRYLHPEHLEERLRQHNISTVCCADYGRLIPLLAIGENGDVLGICRITRFAVSTDSGELKMAIRDDMQYKGIGSAFLKRAMEIAKAENLTTLEAIVHSSNHAMIKVLQRHSWEVKLNEDNKDLFTCRYSVAQ
eukprot:GHVP01050574.1.p1 GENE.GHVP01050574.1~~GHVP01050574.1.p1  ORF type:complete len:948 (+),score=192.26 GHVP01050574.1:50-2845(+)